MKPIITPIRPHREKDSPREVLVTLSDRGAAILVDERDLPIGVLTYSDMSRLKQAVPTAKQAKDLFELGREIYTVSVDEAPIDIARTVVQRGLKTGIVAVDSDRRYAGYVFVGDLRGWVDKLREERQRAEQNLESLKKEHPVVFERVERIFKSGPKDS